MSLFPSGFPRAGLDTLTTTKGKELVFTEPGSFTEYLYARLVCRASGCEILDGLQGNVGLPKGAGKSTGVWVAENPLSNIADSNMTLGQIVLSPRTYSATTNFSQTLFAQSATTARIDAIVTRDLARDAAVALDAAALVGTGTSGHQPLGILNTTGTQIFTLSGDTSNGAIPTFSDCCEMIELLANQNADFGSLGWATSPPIATKLRQTPRSTSIALPVWADDDSIAGWPAATTTSVPKNLTIGTGTNLSLLIAGKWDALTLALWGQGFELVVDPYRLKKQNMIELTSWMLADVGVRIASAFAIAKNVAKS